MYNAVGIDVSKGKSTIAVLQPGGVIVRKPFDVFHTSQSLKELSNYLASLEGDTRIVMECTGRYHESMANSLSNAGFFVTVVNPHLIKNFGNNTLRKVKSDPADAKKIARYTLDNWAELRQYSCMDNTRNQLKTLNSQFSFFMKQKVAAKANLIALLDNTYPGVNKLFNSPAREDGSEKWVDYAYSFWHVDCVRKTGLKAFTVRYEAFCRKHHYIYQPSKPEELFNASKELVAVFPKETSYKLLIQQSIQQLNLASAHIEQLRREMNALASTLPEYEVVMGMYGVGKTYGPQLIAEIGDVSRFTHREAITAFAGVDPGVEQLGQHNSKSNKASKCGTGRLRKTLFQVMTTLLQNAPENEPVYQFLNRKRSEGKPYYVYMTAGANKFLRIYYGKVKAHLRSLEQNE
ncbi:IS110 family RNA-guided transposase [Cuneatibacter caecimuris]|uniref:Transposase IS116/IS110/IS902 family protein n=1 Tax=Cuneatibacter caecimuris TaxID=1796618 RepID=A0A4V2F5A0_9FIRM|nr:IS110 family transposase [Cuneatibacter caecimuris]RZS92089.1 transposase IS116/IS110/IS902 family protein [Cuneatibacter caecimuris]